MADINVLLVTDGTRFNFGPPQAATDLDPSYFGLATLVTALKDPGNVPTIAVYTAHRRRSQIITTYPQTAPHIDYLEDFLFTGTAAHPVNLADYDVIWIIGDEGINGGSPSPTDVPVTQAELEAVAEFMQEGGGVFAVGDHDGIGSYICRHMPRVRTMRRWVYSGDQQPDASGQIFATNWSAMPPDRNDTLRADAADGLFYFEDQSDQKPQPVLAQDGSKLSSAAIVHSVMRGAGGVVIANFPDHMHEGEATDFQTIMGDPPAPKFNPNDGSGNPTKYAVPTGYAASSSKATGFTATAHDEFPNVGGVQAMPEVVAYGSDLGHASLDPTVGATNPKNRGIVSAYDGRIAGIGRIITGSTFHHYLDKNLVGDPMTSKPPGSTRGPTGTNIGFSSLPAILDPIKQFYLNAVAWLARPNPNFYFWTNKNVFGFDEVQTAKTQHSIFPSAFYVVFDGVPAVGNPTIALSGPFSSGLGYQQQPAITVGNRTLIPFDILSIPTGFFPTAGGPNILILEASATAGGNFYAAETEFELVGGADPYFTNVDPGADNVFYLSQDLRVFKATPGSAPFATFPAGAPYTYIANLLQSLNANPSFNVSGAGDPFTVLSAAGDLQEDTSVDPGTASAPNYYFAIARVRLRQGGSTSPSVRVFFRLFATQSNDTDYMPESTYRSVLNSSGLPSTPQQGTDGTTFPMFATPGGSGDYGSGGPNEEPLTIPTTTFESWTYFGCHLDFASISPPLPGTHHCLVAQIAYDGAPIINSTGVTLGPENSDKLAQRNLEITTAGQ
jgi:hypothetical protein